ncbi:MAG: hypothetical protein COA33_013675 [Fluviicola sp.]|nr:hypothetical protein [Fluviicola sp.]
MRIILIISLFWSLSGFGQGEVGYILDDLPTDSLAQRTVKTHSSVKPLIRQSGVFDPKRATLQVSGLADLNYIQNANSSFKTGLGLSLEGAINDKLYFRLAGIEGISQTDNFYYPKTFIGDSIGQVSLYSDIHARVSYTPNHIFNFQVGIDNNFIGEGSRSMFLSDYGASYPFGQIRMRFWRLEYTVLYQFLREKEGNTTNWESKFASSHHISFNAAKWLNFGLFEAVIFQPRDTLLNRGFDAEYLNPFIMYRPQEYSLGSSDNVLIGFELNAYWKKHTFYSQFILDEFVLAEIRAKSKWWANKYGGQFGVKGRFAKGENKFFYRVEYNFARPFTYSHLSPELNYGNQGVALAHPYGASFMELLGEVKWQNKRFFAQVFANYYLRGGSKDGFNYGEDIYIPYINKPFEYGFTIGNGGGMNGTKVVLTLGYQVAKHGKLNAFVENHFNATTLNSTVNYTLVVGLRSMLWNDRRNY